MDNKLKAVLSLIFLASGFFFVLSCFYVEALVGAHAAVFCASMLSLAILSRGEAQHT